MNTLKRLIEFLYNLFAVPVFLFHFIGIPFIFAELACLLCLFIGMNEGWARGIAILLFLFLIPVRVYRALYWDERYNMPKWLSWYDVELRRKIFVSKISNP